MKFLKAFILLLSLTFDGYSQENKRFSLEINYGLNGNFFVRSYDELGGPANKKYFYKKDFLGTIGGAELSYILGKKSFLLVAYNRSNNVGKKNYAGTINGTEIFLRDFELKHVDNFYQFGYGRYLGQKNHFEAEVGAVLVYDSRQTISIENWDNYIDLDQRNFKNSKSVEGGAFLGLEYSTKIDTKFHLGIKGRLYYLISTSSFEAVSLTPTLTYHF